MRTLLAVAAAAVVWTADARACSGLGKYRIPFNFELVKEADLIVLARVKSGPAVPAYGPPPAPLAPMPPPMTGVTLTPVQVLKGRLPAGPLRVWGLTTERGKPVLPAITKLTAAHPSSYEGACIRQAYPVGVLVVAMFRNTPRGPAQLNHPFAREVEDVAGSDDVWVRAVRLYVGALAHPTSEARRAALATDEKAMLSNRNVPGNADIAADIRSYLNHSRRWMEPGGPV